MGRDNRLEGIQEIKPYVLRSSEDMYVIQSPPMLIEDILPKQTITGLTSFPGTGKTWLAFEIMRAIATGGKLLNKFPAEQGSILFVGSDASVMDYARQWRKLTFDEWSENEPTEEEYESGSVTRNPFNDNIRFLLQSDFLFESLDSVRTIIKTSQDFEWGVHNDPEVGPVGNHGFSLIVFDTLSKLTRANQNDNSQMEEVFRNVRLISEVTKAGVVLLHHNAYKSEFNDGESWRGASAQIAALDNWFQLNANESNAYQINVKVKRFRGLTPKPFAYEMVIDDDTARLVYQDEPTSEAAKFDDGLAEGILEFLRHEVAVNKWFSARQVADGIWNEAYQQLFGVSNFEKFKRAIRNRLNEEATKAEPTVARQGNGKRTSTVYYTAIIHHGAVNETNEE